MNAVAHSRQEELLRVLHASGYVSYAEAAQTFGVSEMTIRRDVGRLEADGLARRVSGGASVVGSPHGLPYEERDRRDVAAKRQIGEAVAPLVAGAAVVALDAGTTVLHAVAALPAGATVLTHSVPAITAVAARGELDLVGLGGTYVPETRSFAGRSAVEALAGHVIDVAVLSATALDTSGVMCTNGADAEIKRALVAAAQRVVVLADSSKFASRAPFRFATWDDVTTLVTDSRASAEELDAPRGAGAGVVVPVGQA
ncbi:DeoR/GlpR family DNA-binding transcription regulator [Isoptericola sp. NPDC056618]|uniref:DeoR/GlpR family DNA-binding transcription regulator n=1 Tax=Isoptericola sp. NPDC056618 TaxID=3345878 RepID=UPI003678735B